MSVSFSELYQQDFEIHDIVVLRQSYWYYGEEFTMRAPRPSDALLYFLDCEATCEIPSKASFHVSRGDLVHIARGSKYKWRITGDAPYSPVTLLFEFNLTDKDGNLISTGEGVNIVTVGDRNVYKLLFEKLLHEFSRPQQFPTATKICAYSLLEELIKRHKRQDMVSGNVSEGIYNGIHYLEDDVNQDKTIAEIAQMCHMSLSSFEKQFKQYSEVTPMEYRINKRLDRAELMLKSGTMTINQIAEELGFFDGAYLCRLFKKKRGISPMTFRNIK